MNLPVIEIIHGKIITPNKVLPDGCLLVKEGRIADISDRPFLIPGAIVLDAQGDYVAPGCIDTHIHGGGGHDFMEATTEAFYAIAGAHLRHGITSLYPTLAAASPETFRRAVEVCRYTMDHPRGGAHILGLHLEGNYLNPQMKGGQNPDFLTLPHADQYRELLSANHCIRRWSAAPELAGAMEFGRYAADRGVVVSIAHTTADAALVEKAYRNGFTHVTHFYNAMTGVHKVREYKHAGTIEGIYLIDGMTVELIGDGIHVPPAILRLVHKVKGPDRIALITDAMCAAAWTDADTPYSDPRIILEDGVGKLADRSALASSIATGDRLIRTMVQEAGLPLVDAVKMASETPARIMGIHHRKGLLQKGMDADIIVFDENIRLRAVMAGGMLSSPSLDANGY